MRYSAVSDNVKGVVFWEGSKKALDVWTEGWRHEIHPDALEHFEYVRAVVKSDGFVSVENLSLSAGSLGWAMEFEITVSIGYELLKGCIHCRASCIGITVIDVH